MDNGPMTADELARLRGETRAAKIPAYWRSVVLSLIDALEKAHGELDDAHRERRASNDVANRIGTERDAAHALLRDVDKWLSQHTHATYLRARITAMIGERP